MNLQKFLLISVTLLLLVACTVAYAAGIGKHDKSTAADQPEAVSAQSAVGQPVSQSSTRTGEQIKWQVISSGGTDGSSASYDLVGTVAQTAVGTGSSPSYGLGHGFWQPVPAGGCCQLRADINHDGSGPDIADLVYLVTYMFQFGDPPPCMEEADINGDGVGPDIADLVYLVTYMFQFGPEPVPCP